MASTPFSKQTLSLFHSHRLARVEVPCHHLAAPLAALHAFPRSSSIATPAGAFVIASQPRNVRPPTPTLTSS